MRSKNIFQKFSYFLLIISFSLLGACVTGEKTGTEEKGKEGTTVGEGLTTPTGPHFCEQEANKGSEGCQLVLAGFSGSFKWLNLPTITGYFRNHFYPDGKLKSMALYRDQQSDKPQVDHIYTYDGQGRPLTIESFSDTDFNGSFDTKLALSHRYNLNPPTKMTQIDGTLTPPDDPLNILANSYRIIFPGDQPVPMNPPLLWGTDQIFTAYIVHNIAQNIKTGTTELQTINPDGTLNSSRIINTGPQLTIETVAERKAFAYVDGKPASLIHNLYHCPDQAGATCMKPQTPTSPPADLKDVLNAYLKIETTWEYIDGKLKKIGAEVDGDFDAHGPKAGIDGTIDATVTCELDHFPFKGNVIAAFPDEMKAVGLSNEDQIKTLHCHDNGLGLVDVNLEFTDWRYLRDVTGEKS